MTTDTAPPARNGEEFHRAEFQALRAEITQHSSANDSLEWSALVGSVAIYSWYLVNTGRVGTLALHAVVLLLPVALTYVSWMKAKYHGQRIGEIGLYLKGLGAAYGSPIRHHGDVEAGDWESYLHTVRQRQFDNLESNLNRNWLIYLIATAAISLFILTAAATHKIHVLNNGGPPQQQQAR